MTHRDADGFDVGRWLPRARRAMQQLDLVIFVPVENPDRADQKWRSRWRV